MNRLRAETTTHEKQERLYYLDWLRVLAVVGVFYAHTANILDSFYWHINNDAPNHTVAPDYGLRAFIVFGTQWGMSLFFLLAGASAWFALRSKTSGQFIHERFNRLVIPYVVGFILLSPPEAYFLALAHSLYQGSFFAFYLHFFGSIRIDWNPQWLAAYGYHLWFLAFLFAISLINLPVIFYLRRESGQRFIRKLAALCEKPWGIFLFILPIALIQVALRAPFPVYQGWADFFTWLMFFLYGYILLTDRRFQHAIKKQGIVAFFVGLASFLIILATYFAGFLNTWEGTPSYSVGYMLYQVLRSVTAWSWMVFALYFGMHVLNFSSKLLEYAEEAVLPFYMLHYPLVIIIAFYIVQWDMSPSIKLLIISTISLVTTVILYDLLIRRMNFTRRLFGMKPRERDAGTDLVVHEHDVEHV